MFCAGLRVCGIRSSELSTTHRKLQQHPQGEILVCIGHRYNMQLNQPSTSCTVSLSLLHPSTHFRLSHCACPLSWSHHFVFDGPELNAFFAFHALFRHCKDEKVWDLQTEMQSASKRQVKYSFARKYYFLPNICSLNSCLFCWSDFDPFRQRNAQLVARLHWHLHQKKEKRSLRKPTGPVFLFRFGVARVWSWKILAPTKLHTDCEMCKDLLLNKMQHIM